MPSKPPANYIRCPRQRQTRTTHILSLRQNPLQLPLLLFSPYFVPSLMYSYSPFSKTTLIATPPSLQKTCGGNPHSESAQLGWTSNKGTARCVVKNKWGIRPWLKAEQREKSSRMVSIKTEFRSWEQRTLERNERNDQITECQHTLESASITRKYRMSGPDIVSAAISSPSAIPLHTLRAGFRARITPDTAADTAHCNLDHEFNWRSKHYLAPNFP